MGLRYGNINIYESLLFDPKWMWLVSIGILIGEFVLNIFVINQVNYTEIDWIAYMQECEGFLNGTMDYSKLRGNLCPKNYLGKVPAFLFIKLIFLKISVELQAILDHWFIQLHFCTFIQFCTSSLHVEQIFDWLNTFLLAFTYSKCI